MIATAGWSNSHASSNAASASAMLLKLSALPWTWIAVATPGTAPPET